MSVLKEERHTPLDNFKYQIICGKIVSMAPSAPNHVTVSYGLSYIFKSYFRGKECKKCKIYHEGNYIRLDIIKKTKNIKLPDGCDKDKYTPDVMVICDRSIDTLDGVIGAPDLVVEVLSRSTEKYDMTIKKEVYESIGVKEYWIVDYKRKSIEVYVLQDGKYYLKNMYHKYAQHEIEIDIINSELITEFSPFIFPDLTIQIDDVFDDMIDE